MMVQDDLWNELLAVLEGSLEILPDKPEESPESTLRALWWKVYGKPISVVSAVCEAGLPAITNAEINSLRKLINQRLTGVPLAHLTGRQHFMGLDLFTSPSALIPRKETELLAEAALKVLQDMAAEKEHLVYIDVCTGVGNLPIVLANEVPGVVAYASDLSVDAVQLAKKNIDFFNLKSRVSVRQGDLLTPFESEDFFNKVDLITCNPPYISSNKVGELHSEISDHEPSLAFDGGPFGVSILRKLIAEAPAFLKPGGWLVFEVGLGQGESMVKRMEKKYDYELVRAVVNENGEIRAISARM